MGVSVQGGVGDAHYYVGDFPPTIPPSPMPHWTPMPPAVPVAPYPIIINPLTEDDIRRIVREELDRGKASDKS